MTGPRSRLFIIRCCRTRRGLDPPMRLQLGSLHLDGRPASQEDWSALLGQFAWKAAETSGEVIDGPLVMAYRGDRITVEEKYEVQPLRWGPYMLTWDGRLDNREELADRVGLNH